MSTPLLDPQLADWQAGDPGTLPTPAPFAVSPVAVQPSKEQIRLGMELSAAFLVVRHLVSQRLTSAVPAGDERGQAHFEWQAHAPIWVRLALPAVRAAMALAAPQLSQADLEAAAVDYTAQLGGYLDDTSAEALAEGLARQLGAKWDRQLAWQRASAGYGLDRRRMSAWIAGVLRGAELNPVDPIPAASRAQLDSLLLQRADVLGVEEAARAVESGKSLAWLIGYRTGMFTPGTVKEWDCTLENTCAVCAPLHRQQQAPDQPFVMPDGSTVWSPSLHPGCRCTTHLLSPLGKRYDPAEARDWHGRWAADEEAAPTEPPPPPPGGGEVSFGSPGGQVSFGGAGPVAFGTGQVAFNPAAAAAPAQPITPVSFTPATAEPVSFTPAPAEEPVAPAAAARSHTVLRLSEQSRHIAVDGVKYRYGVPWYDLNPGSNLSFGVPGARPAWTEAHPGGQEPVEPVPTLFGGARTERRYLAPETRPIAVPPPLDHDVVAETWYGDSYSLRQDLAAEVARFGATEWGETVERLHDGDTTLIFQLAGAPVPASPSQRREQILSAVLDGELPGNNDKAPELSWAAADWLVWVNTNATDTDDGITLGDGFDEWADAHRFAQTDLETLPPVQNLFVFDGFAPGDDDQGIAGNYRVESVEYHSRNVEQAGTAGTRYIHMTPGDEELGKAWRGSVSAFGVDHAPAT